ncbi:MAG: type I DNA topoisomerase [Bdellovibrionota bacterium]
MSRSTKASSSSGSKLVIVESPTKAKTLRKFLPKNYVIEASMGHIRDLPQTAADIPKDLKKEAWSRLGVNVENGFDPIYVIPKQKSKIVSELKKKLKDADELYLATDEDREGESISWHLMEILKPKVPVKRMVFHEITKSAIEKAVENTREVDDKLVRAQETRRILDRLVGYTLSPLIWKKVAYGLSAGRVQSVGLRVIVERERARMRFVKSSYCDLESQWEAGSESFPGRLTEIAGRKLAQGKDFEEETGKLKDSKLLQLGEKEAAEYVDKWKALKGKVLSLEEKPFTTNPSAPFITSTLQQESNRKLGLTSRETMRIAQRLYEEGMITYMRTDSPNLSTEALKAARSLVEDLYGKEFLSATPRQFTSKAKGAQEAHEAIRPSGSVFVQPKESGLEGKELALYELIWKRTVASQMAEAKKLSVTLKIKLGDGTFQSSGSRILFPGFLRAYVEGSDDPEASLSDQEVIIPKLKEGETVDLKNLKALDHETKPPARFTEASLIKILEKEGIGRPSTYASIIDTIQSRGYVSKQGNALIPSYTGFAVIQILEKHFSSLVDLGFTASMEESLDGIASGEVEWLPYLKKFYLGKTGLQTQVEKKDKEIDPDESRTLHMELKLGADIKIGRFGAYIEKGELHASLPIDMAPADLTSEKIKEILQRAKDGPQSIGKDPKTGLDIYALQGRFGPYVQLGQMKEGSEEKPRRASIPKEVAPHELTLEKALELLSLPKELGLHPETQKPVVANIGRFGPYLIYDGEFRSLKKDDNVYKIDLARALEILAEPKVGRSTKILKDLGQDPKTKKKVSVLEGKFGPYAKVGMMNLSLPKGTVVEKLTLEDVLKIRDEKKKK